MNSDAPKPLSTPTTSSATGTTSPQDKPSTTESTPSPRPPLTREMFANWKHDPSLVEKYGRGFVLVPNVKKEETAK